MNTIQRVARNTSILVVGEISFKIISLFVTIFLARYLGIVGFGKYSFVFAYLAFFNILTDLGLQKILIREMSRDFANAPKLIGNAYIIRGILTVFAIVLSLSSIRLLSYPADTITYVYIATFTLLFISFSDFYRTIFEANLRMEYNIFAKLAFKIISAILILWIIFSHGTLIQIMLVLVFSEGIKTLISYSFSRKFVKPQFSIDFGLWRYILKECLPLALSSVIWVIYYEIDKVMLSLMVGDAAVGLYSAAYKLCDPLLLIPVALTTSLFPLMSVYFENSKEKLIKTYSLGFRYLIIIMLPIAIGVTLQSNKIILLIYGTEYAYSAITLQILIWSIVFGSLNIILLSLFVSMDKQGFNTLSTGISTIVNVILNLSLIPILSYNGAAIATVVTGVVLFISCLYLLSMHLNIPPIHKMLVRPIIGGLTMAAFLHYFGYINMFLLIPLSGMVYLAVLLALKSFIREDWEILKKMIKYKVR